MKVLAIAFCLGLCACSTRVFADNAAGADGDVPITEGAPESVDGVDSEQVSEVSKEDKRVEDFKEKYDKWLSEKQDPKYDLEPLKLGGDLMCSACSLVTETLADAITAVQYTMQDKPLKERRATAIGIVDGVCEKLTQVEIQGDKPYQRFALVGKSPVVKPLELDDKENTTDDSADNDNGGDDSEASAEAAMIPDNEDAARENDEQSGTAEHEAQLLHACKLMLANHGSKLKTNISGFYKDTGSSSLKKKLCYQWQDLCGLPPKSKLKKREKCLMKVFKGIEVQDFETVQKYLPCAQKELKKKKQKFSDANTDQADTPDEDVLPTENDDVTSSEATEQAVEF